MPPAITPALGTPLAPTSSDISEHPEFLSELRKIPYKYDDKGSYYFHRITLTQDYYLTRKEQELLDNKLDQMLKDVQRDAPLVEVVEMGCGMGRKTVAFLTGLLSHITGTVRFVPIDVSPYYLQQLQKYYSSAIQSTRLTIHPYCGGYHDYLESLRNTVHGTADNAPAQVSSPASSEPCCVGQCEGVKQGAQGKKLQKKSSHELGGDGDSAQSEDSGFGCSGEGNGDVLCEDGAVQYDSDSVWNGNSVVHSDGSVVHGGDEVTHRLMLFMGSSLGNYSCEQQGELLGLVGSCLRTQDMFMLGLDTTLKPASAIEAAYDDSEGWSAKFNLNTLRNVNKALDCGFNVDYFKHYVVLRNSTLHTYAVSTAKQQVTWQGQCVTVRAGYELLLEISDKYDQDKVEALAKVAGLSLKRVVWGDDKYYMIACLTKA